MEDLTFEAVDKHVNETYSAHHQGLNAAAPKEVSIDQLKAIYIVVRPILRMVATIPLIPAKWRQAINTFLTVLDAVTGTLGVA